MENEKINQPDVFAVERSEYEQKIHDLERRLSERETTIATKEDRITGLQKANTEMMLKCELLEKQLTENRREFDKVKRNYNSALDKNEQYEREKRENANKETQQVKDLKTTIRMLVETFSEKVVDGDLDDEY